MSQWCKCGHDESYHYSRDSPCAWGSGSDPNGAHSPPCSCMGFQHHKEKLSLILSGLHARQPNLDLSPGSVTRDIIESIMEVLDPQVVVEEAAFTCTHKYNCSCYDCYKGFEF